MPNTGIGPGVVEVKSVSVVTQLSQPVAGAKIPLVVFVTLPGTVKDIAVAVKATPWG
jgi:hypothetical protein